MLDSSSISKLLKQKVLIEFCPTKHGKFPKSFADCTHRFESTRSDVVSFDYGFDGVVAIALKY